MLFLHYQRPKSGQGSALSLRENRPEIKTDTIYRVPTNALRVFVPLCLCIMFFAFPVAAQDAPPLPNPAAAFVAYQCNFQAATNSADIHAVLMGSDSRPLPPSGYT